MDEKDEAAKRIAERSVAEVANALGVTVDAAAIVERATMIVDSLKGGTWKKIIALGDDAAAKITTLEEAVESARSRK
jgi:ribosomal protein L12E/L44/L45/RPP1/RPP2